MKAPFPANVSWAVAMLLSEKGKTQEYSIEAFTPYKGQVALISVQKDRTAKTHLPLKNYNFFLPTGLNSRLLCKFALKLKYNN